MGWLQAPDYWLTRFVFERALGILYLIAFLVAINQFRPLLGEEGLLPVPLFVRSVGFWQSPSIFHLHFSDRFVGFVAWLGVALSALVATGLIEIAPSWVSILVWLALWVLYLSIVNVGQVFYAFGWESLLLEVGLLVVFFGNGRMLPPTLEIWLLRWVLFRLEFGAGLIKLRGDPCWRDLTCLYYHHETQPMPNPLSWYFHNLPKSLHKVEVLGNHFAQLVVPFGLFTPQPIAAVAGAIIVLTQSWLMLSGNFAWLNYLTITLALTAFDDRFLGHILPFKPHALAGLPFWWQIVSVALTYLVVILSYRPVRNLLSRRQVMNSSFNRFHFVNTYGAFGSITRTRYEVVLEGTDQHPESSSPGWKEYEFKGKPGDPMRRPPQVAPYHLRLDWLMWFAALTTPLTHPWIIALTIKLLENDPSTIKLLRRNPFPDQPPTFVRALLYRYRYTSWDERRQTRAWWVREVDSTYLPPLRLRRAAEGAPVHGGPDR